MVKVSSGGRLFGPSGFEEFSAGLAIGDFNGDGVDDLALTYVQDGSSRDSSTAIVRILLGGSNAFDGDAQVADLGGVTITTSGQIDAGVGIDKPGELSFADVDGDGLDDLLIGAPRAILGPNERGAGYVALGVNAADSLTYGLADLTNEVTGFSIVTNETGLAGFGFRALGDVDGDDRLDLLITSPYATALNGTRVAGLGFVFEHQNTTNLDVSDALDAASGFSATVLAPQTRVFLGEEVAAVGDVNGDGLDDFILSARGDIGASANAFPTGAAYLIYGNAGGLPETIDVANLDGAIGTKLVSSLSLTLGTRVAAAGDVNGDGIDDFMVGDTPVGGIDTFAYLVYGTDGGFGELFDMATQTNGRVTQIGGATSARIQTGLDMVAAGDVNGDGFDDVIVSRADAGPNRGGDALLLFGTADGLGDFIDYENVATGGGYRFDGISFYENAGFSVAGGGDLNGDGVDDLVIGARYALNVVDDDPNTNLTGAAYVVYGGAERLAALDALSGADGVIALADVGAEVDIDVIIPNDPPVGTPTDLGTFSEDGGARSFDLTDYVTDPDGDPLTIAVIGDLPEGVTRDGNMLHLDPDALADAAMLGARQDVTTSILLTATDTAGNTSDRFGLSFTVTGVDDPLIVPDLAFEVFEGDVILMDAFAEIMDADGAIPLGWGPLGSLTPTTDPFELPGILGVTSGGVFGYLAADPTTLDPNGTGIIIASGTLDPLAEGATRTVSFTYFGGGPGEIGAGDVTITITGVNDAPEIADTVLGTFAEDAAVQSIRLSDLASDLDGDVIQINLLDTLPTGVSWDGDILRIDPDAFADAVGLGDGAEETVTLRATASDAVGNTSEVVALDFTVTGIDDPLIVPDLTFEVFEGDTVLMDLFAAITDADDDAVGLGWGPLGSLTPSLDPFTLTGVLGLTGGVFGYAAVDPLTLDPNPIGVIASDSFGPLAEDETRSVSFTYFGGHPGDFAAGDVTITVTGVNDAPVFTSAAMVSVIEGTTTLIDVNAIDDTAAELDGLTYELATGGESALFTIDAANGQLSFAAPPDFEAPGDENTDNMYTVNVVASDGALSTTQSITVSVEPDLTPVTLTVMPGVTTLIGNGGADILLGAIGANTLNGAGGNDTVGAPAGQNVIMGSAGNDLLQGGINDDVLSGGAGNDVISGDLGTFLFGSDTITGGAGDDMMMGGAGADVFVFSQNDGRDVIGALAINYANPASTTVTGVDFESGVDQVDVSVLGYASVADAFARVSDVGGVATFSDQGTEITFAGLTRADLDQNDFIIA